MSPADPPLTDADRALLSARADRFHDAVSRSLPPADWEPFLLGVPPRLRRAVLTEFVIVDLARRWKRGERALLEEYLTRFPELGPADRLSPKLLAEEFRARLRAGDPADSDQYRRRFPVQFPQVVGELEAVESEAASWKKSPPPATRTVGPGDTFTSPPPSLPSLPAVPPLPRSGVTAAASRSRTADFTRLKSLGSGQFGEVWLVEARGTNMRKAMKIMRRTDDDTVKRELRSLDLIKNETSPYLLRTEDYWLDDDKLHVLMEVADGTLSNWLAEYNAGAERRNFARGVPVGELLHVFREAAEVIDELHVKQVMHRDIKPDNILLLNRHAKVADFGLARQQDANVATQSIMAGSPAYMAPEVWDGRFGGASDLYSLAVTYMEMRQGKLPVKLGAMTEIMFAHLEGKFIFAECIGAKEEAVVRKALAKDPAKRFPTCTAFVDELVRVVGVPLAPPGYTRPAASRPHLPAIPVAPPSPADSMELSFGSEVDFGPAKPRDRRTATPAPGPAPVRVPPAPAATATKSDILLSYHLDPPTRGEEALPLPADPPNKKGKGWLWPALLAGLVLLLGGGVAVVMLNLPKPPPPGTSGSTGSTGTGGVVSPTTDPVTPHTGPPPPVKEYWTPTGTERVGQAELVPLAGGKKVPLWVAATVGGETVRFRLVSGGGPDKVNPFYISERKVSNALVYGTDPKEGGTTGPAMEQTAADVVTTIGKHFREGDGRLPTPAEWDCAAGLFDPGRNTQATVTVAGGKPRVNQKEPSGIGSAPFDENLLGLIDMAGNGREWTCGVLRNPDQPINAANGPDIEVKLDGQFPADSVLVLRGQNFTFEKGLTFAQLEKERTTQPQVQRADRKSQYTGFRVVLPIK